MTNRYTFVLFFVIGATMGAVLSTISVATPVNILAPPAQTIQIPAPGNPDHYVSTRTVLDLVDVLTSIHKEAEALKVELQSTREEARRIVQAMIQEINRLRSRPTLKPVDPTIAQPEDEDDPYNT